MATDDAQFLASLPTLAVGFVLVFCRIGAAVALLPGFAETEAPARLRIGIALALTVLILPIVGPSIVAVPDAVAPLAGLIGGELLVGAMLGWLAKMIALALPMAGQVLAYMMGLSSVLIPDATLGAQGTALGRLFNLVAPVLLFATGLHVVPISALVASYDLFPVGHGLPAGDVATTLIAAIAGGFALAIRLAAPLILAGLVWQVALGALARLVPTVQVFFVLQPAQIIGGFILLGLCVTGMLGAWTDAARTGLAALPHP